MNRQFPDFIDTMEWNLVARESYQVQQTSAKTYNPIPEKSWLIADSHLLMIGIQSGVYNPRWHTGGWASQLLPFLPSSTSEFVAAVQSSNRRLRLGILNLVTFPKIISPYILQVSFPYWLEEVRIEVWRYDGQDLDVFNYSTG